MADAEEKKPFKKITYCYITLTVFLPFIDILEEQLLKKLPSSLQGMHFSSLYTGDSD